MSLTEFGDGDAEALAGVIAAARLRAIGDPKSPAMEQAQAILDSDWLADMRAKVWDEGNAFAQGYDLHYYLDRDEWEGEPKSGPNPYRSER